MNENHGEFVRNVDDWSSRKTIFPIKTWGMNRQERESLNSDRDIEQIKTIITAMSEKYQGKGGEVQFAGVDGATVKIAPAGFCWR